MDVRFKVPKPADSQKLVPYFTLRPCKACESGWVDYFIWSEYYRVRYEVADEKALLVVMKSKENEYFAALPYCEESDLPHYFDELKRFFNEVLKQPFKIFLADEEGVEALHLRENPNYVVREEEDFKDYIYDAQELRTLPGRKFQKKRNLINKFLKAYEGRWEYRTLCCSYRDEILAFLDSWFPNHEDEEADGAGELVFERDGLRTILIDCCCMNYRCGGIYIDGTLKAFSLGTYNAREEMACISVEKADPETDGLYQLINREFIVHEFPEAKLVNREDDMGLPGLRQAKLSYNPVMFEKKYMIVQKNFEGRRVDTTDPYEEEVRTYKTAAESLDAEKEMRALSDDK